MDDAGPQSLFVVVARSSVAPYSSSIIQLETQVDNHEYASSANTPVFQTEFSAHIPHLPRVQRMISWVISLPPASSTEDLYMLPDWYHKKKAKKENDGTLPGFIFNLSTKKCKIIKPPLGPKYNGHVVTMGDHIYFMAQPHLDGRYPPDPCFERYDTLSQSWEELEPLPPSDTYGNLYSGIIEGTAVLDDTILFNIDGCELQAYNVGRNKWYPVMVSNNLCYCIEGVGVVVNKIIYAITLPGQSVVALTLKSQEIKGDLVYTCDLHKEYVVPGMEQIKLELWDSYQRTRHFVHLGKDNFCVVHCVGQFGVTNHQYIQLTNMVVSEKKSIVTNICLHELKTPHGDQFIIRHCFSMPKCKTTALQESKRFLKFNPEHEAEIVTPLPPELLQFLDKYSSQTNIIDEQDFEQAGSVSQSSQSRDHADTTPEVQEDVSKKSSASVVAAKSNVPSKASTIFADTGHQSLSYAKPSSATKASTLGDGAASGRSNTDDEGHSIYIRNLPHDANSRQLVKGLKKFGPIKSVGIHTDFSNGSECCFANVEFESATSKQNAIEASPITIGGCLVVIEEKRGTGLTQGDSNRTSGSSTSSRNKFKNHGEDSRCQTTSGGHNVGKGCRNRTRRPKGGRK